jgi:predicted PurR-regulated permease PerM
VITPEPPAEDPRDTTAGDTTAGNTAAGDTAAGNTAAENTENVGDDAGAGAEAGGATARLRQLGQQWAQLRAERTAAEAPSAVAAGPSNFSRAQVPWGYDVAAAWAWRFVVICAAGYILLWLLARYATLTVPIAVALLVSAMAFPAVERLARWGVPRKLASGGLVVGGVATVGLLLTFVGSTVSQGAKDLAASVADGIQQIEIWLKTGPLKASDSQINSYLEKARETITERAQNPDTIGQVTHVGTALGHVVAGFFIVLFASYFFLAEGGRIWAWVVRLTPRAARRSIDGSGRVAWVALTNFVRATVFVALADAIGISVGAAILGVPFVPALGVLVFLGAFVPMIGATIAGTVAILVALVSNGPITALLMLGVVILVQQIEGHVLQPFLMGKLVSVHPLGVIAAIACGVITAGIVGALIAVPLAAAGNAVVQYLAAAGDPEAPDPSHDAINEDDRP